MDWTQGEITARSRSTECTTSSQYPSVTPPSTGSATPVMNELVAVVEDEEDIRALVAAGLRKERFRVRELADGRGLRAALREERPSLVVLDLMLPDIDGFALCRSLRSERETSSLPIIILTAYARHGLPEQVAARDGFHLCQKPVDYRDLHDLIHRVVRWPHSR